MVAQLLKFIEDQTVCLQWVNFMIYEDVFQKAISYLLFIERAIIR